MLVLFALLFVVLSLSMFGLYELQLPANTCGNPMTYMVNNKQYIVVAVGAQNFPAELVALSLP